MKKTKSIFKIGYLQYAKALATLEDPKSSKIKIKNAKKTIDTYLTERNNCHIL